MKLVVAAPLGVALTTPHVASAKCDEYFLGICTGDGFCVVVDTTAGSGTLDNPFSETLEDRLVGVSLTQSAFDDTTAVAMATTTASAGTGSTSDT